MTPRCDSFARNGNLACALGAGCREAAFISLAAGTLARSALQRDGEIDDLDLVLDERPAGFAVLPAPFDIGEGNAIALDQEPRSSIGKRVDHRRRAGRWIVVELGTWPIDVAGVKEAHEAIIGAIK
jgi:hypothetical protein